MFNPKVQKIWLAQYKVDFRKGHTGLLAETRKHNLNLWDGDVAVFVSKCRKRVKVLYADSTGLWLSYKQFSADTLKTDLKFLSEPSIKSISTAELSILLEGSRGFVDKKALTWQPS